MKAEIKRKLIFIKKYYQHPVNEIINRFTFYWTEDGNMLDCTLVKWPAQRPDRNVHLL